MRCGPLAAFVAWHAAGLTRACRCSQGVMGSGKPRGINAARKLRTVRVKNRWANKSYKKANLGTQYKCNPFGGSSHCKGIVLEKM